MAGTTGRKNTAESRLRNGATEVPCAQCGALRWVPKWAREKGQGRFCSRACKAAWQREHPSASKGIRRKDERLLRADGYISLWAPDHPAAHDGRVLEHRVIAEASIGRLLIDGEEVHHRNGARADNRPENLEVLTAAEHYEVHRLARTAQLREARTRHPTRRDPDTGKFLSRST